MSNKEYTREGYKHVKLKSGDYTKKLASPDGKVRNGDKFGETVHFEPNKK